MQKLAKWNLCNSVSIIVMQGAQLQKHIVSTLGSGNLKEAVRLPTGEDPNEWLAVNSMTLYLLYFI